MPRPDEFALPSSLRHDHLLTWEYPPAGGESGEERWWLARARDESAGREFFVAEDIVSGHLVGVVRPRPKGRFQVIGTVRLGEGPRGALALAEVKEQISRWRIAPHESALRNHVRRWRARRAWIIARGNFPMALGALVVGGALGTIVTYFAGYSELAGGPMVVAGLLIGAGAGLTLKVIADHRPPTYPGSWGRFAVVTGAAILGAGSAAVGVLALFWN